MSEHSPTPWVKQTGSSADGGPQISWVEDANGCSVADLYYLASQHCIPHGGQAEANAALIVRAVNSHQVMVDALEFYADDKRYQGANQRAFEGDKYTEADAPFMQDMTRDWGKIARAALKLAKGE